MTATLNHAGYDFQFSDSDVVSPADFIPAGEYNPHNVRAWYVHDHGFCVGVTFASCESDALDILRDETDARLFGAYLQETTGGALVVVAEGVVSSDLPVERVTKLYRAWRKRR